MGRLDCNQTVRDVSTYATRCSTTLGAHTVCVPGPVQAALCQYSTFSRRLAELAGPHPSASGVVLFDVCPDSFASGMRTVWTAVAPHPTQAPGQPHALSATHNWRDVVGANRPSQQPAQGNYVWLASERGTSPYASVEPASRVVHSAAGGCVVYRSVLARHQPDSESPDVSSMGTVDGCMPVGLAGL